MNQELISRAIGLLLNLIELAILPFLGILIRQYVKNRAVKDALDVVQTQTLLAVQRLNKQRRELRDPTAPGTWTEAEATALKNGAISQVRIALGQTLDILVERYGSQRAVDLLIGQAVDAHAEATRPSVLSSAPAAPAEQPRGTVAPPEPIAPAADPSVPAVEPSVLAAEPSDSAAATSSVDPASGE